MNVEYNSIAPPCAMIRLQTTNQSSEVFDFLNLAEWH